MLQMNPSAIKNDLHYLEEVEIVSKLHEPLTNEVWKSNEISRAV